jgi:hypothetical protein
MRPPEEFLAASQTAFESDPFGYSTLAWTRWAMAQNLSGRDIDPEKPPTSADLKSPLLWLTQAHALSQAAENVIRSELKLNHLPVFTRGVCHSQYCAVALMLVGYSLEICLKGMLILRKGVDAYIATEKTHRHHDLVKLSEFIPDLSAKDLAILKLLTQFVVWAGRYPDPGSGRKDQNEGIFTLSEEHQITARELFATAALVMSHVRAFVE